jgi:UPF0755 protein
VTLVRRVLHAVLALLVVAALLGGAGLYALRLYDAPGPLAQARNVVVPHGGLDTVAEALQQAQVIDNPWRFRVAVEVTRNAGALHAAELAFPQHASLRQVLDVLRFGAPVQHYVTIPEGLTSAQIAELLEQAEALTGPAVVPPEGSILPNTYEYEYGTDRGAIIARAHAALQHALAELWKTRAPDLPLTSPEQAVILASIVERETARPDERPMVAAVFINRLRLGMPLQSDPTVIYAVSGGLGRLDRPISHADLDGENPYNTYFVHGLPPGPICAPGIASLNAVLHPATTDDLYFVADGTGGHVFAHTLQEHDVNVAHYRGEMGSPQKPDTAHP